MPEETRAGWDPLSPFPWYQEMRERGGTWVGERGALNVFDYADVKRVLSDYEVFSSQFAGDQPSPHNPIGASLIAQDPPRHRQLRALVSQAFTPRAIDRLQPRIETISRELLDAVSHQARLDAVQDFSYPLPVIVISEMLGIPPSQRAQFKRWSDAVVSGRESAEAQGEPGSDLYDMAPAHVSRQDLLQEMNAYFREMIGYRRQHPGDDLISGLLAAEVDGQHLTELELLGFCVLLLVAGNETTTNLITSTLLLCLERPAVKKGLWSDPDRLPQAVEETLRLRSPVQSMYRVAKKDTEVKGQPLRAGQPVVAWIGSANQDPNPFENPEEFGWSRGTRDHIAFGHGIHTCLGAPLARLEARIAIGQWIRRIDQMTLVPGTRLEPMASSVVFGVRSLPLEVTWQA